MTTSRPRRATRANSSHWPPARTARSSSSFSPIEAMAIKWIQNEVPALHGSRAGHLQHHPPARLAGRQMESFSWLIPNPIKWLTTSKSFNESQGKPQEPEPQPGRYSVCAPIRTNATCPSGPGLEYLEFLLNNREASVPSFGLAPTNAKAYSKPST